MTVLQSASFAESLESYRSESEKRAHSILEGARLDGRAELYERSSVAGSKAQATEVTRLLDRTADKVEKVMSHEGSVRRPEKSESKSGFHGKPGGVRGRSR